MRYTISGKNINITPGLKDAVESKLGKLERYFSPDTEVQVTLSVEKGRQKIEVTIPVKGSIIRAEQDSSDMYVSVDLVEEIIERQIKKYKTKIVDKKQSALAFSEAFLQEEAEQEGCQPVLGIGRNLRCNIRRFRKGQPSANCKHITRA